MPPTTAILAKYASLGLILGILTEVALIQIIRMSLDGLAQPAAGLRIRSAGAIEVALGYAVLSSLLGLAVEAAARRRSAR